MAKIQGSASQHLTMTEANEAKVTGALDRLRMCLELCMKAACGQDLGLLDGDPLIHSPEVKAVVELRHSLDRQREQVTHLNGVCSAAITERDFLDDVIFTFNRVRTDDRIKELDEWAESIDPKYIEMGQKLIALAYKFREQSEQLILCRQIANGEAEHLDVVAGSAVEAVQKLRVKFYEGKAYKPTPPGPVPSAPPDNPKLPENFLPKPSSFNPFVSSGEEFSDDAELNEVKNLRSKFPKVDLKWALWRLTEDERSRTFYIARCEEGHTAAFVYWPMGNIFWARFHQKQTHGCTLIATSIFVDDEIFLKCRMEDQGINP